MTRSIAKIGCRRDTSSRTLRALRMNLVDYFYFYFYLLWVEAFELIYTSA
jgi:hypothetical protein